MLYEVYIVFGSKTGSERDYILGVFKDDKDAFHFKEKYEISSDCTFSLVWVNSFVVH